MIRALVLELTQHYGVTRIFGFRNGYQGMVSEVRPTSTVELDRGRRSAASTSTAARSSAPRAATQDPEEIVDCLEQLGVNILFVIGGDGSMRGALRIAEVVAARDRRIAVVGVPKTIDNDIPYIDQSFGFQTAFGKATESIRAAHVEAQRYRAGVGLVQLMGRHSGFIACYAALANNDADYVLIPEVPFEARRLPGAPAPAGAGRRGTPWWWSPRAPARSTCRSSSAGWTPPATCASVTSGCTCGGGSWSTSPPADLECNLKYIDPSYAIRSVPANPYDSVYCIRLAHSAVHAAMAGRTAMVVGRWRGRSVHVPMTARDQQPQPGRPGR